MEQEKSDSALKAWEAVSKCFVEIAGAIEPRLLQGQRLEGEHRPSEWSDLEYLDPTKHRRYSSEWETDTLVDPSMSGSRTSSTRGWEQTWFPCPFRKRNPVRFNIRDHERCARGAFPSLSKVRHHIILYHQRPQSPFQCPRCKFGFDSETALQNHLVVPKGQMCEVKVAQMSDPEDGITEQIRLKLARYDDGEDVWTWDKIWQLVFPEDTEALAPDFEPVVELVEAEHVFDEGQDTLKAALRDKLRLLLPNTVDDQYCNFLASQLDLIFETHRVNMARECLARCRNGEHHNVPRRPNRRSRRNTLLQGLHRSTPEPSRTLSGHTHTRTVSIRYTGIDPPEPDSESLKTAVNRRTWTQRPHSIIANSPRTSNAAINSASSANPRDSCDSGIGMPCDTCNSSEPRSRANSRTQHSMHSASLCCSSSFRQTFDTDTTTGAGTVIPPSLTCPPAQDATACTRTTPGPAGSHHRSGQEVANSSSSASRKLKPARVSLSRQRPVRLDVDTWGLGGPGNGDGEWLWSAGLGSASGGGMAGGRYSPESFKQRVLRKQAMGG
ncbi:hypothetical protein VTK26DRAFT_7111 [Humicola hyalothermophila]